MRIIISCIAIISLNSILYAQKTEFISFEPALNHSYIGLTNKYPPYETREAYVIVIYPRLSYHLNSFTEIGILGGYSFVKSDFAFIEEGNGYIVGTFARFFPQKCSFNQIAELGDYKIRIRGKVFFAAEYSTSTSFRDENEKNVFSKKFYSHSVVTDAGLRFFLWKELYFSFQLGVGYNFNSRTKDRFFFDNFFTFGYTFTKKNKKWAK